MKPVSLLLKLNHHWLLLCSLFVAILVVGCGTLQVDLAPTAGPVARPGVPLTPTPWFGPPNFAAEAGVLFDDRLNLEGFTVQPDSAEPGSRVAVTLIWKVLDKVDADYNTFVHMMNDDDQLVAQSDRPTGGGYRLPADWIINEYIYDQHHLVLPAGMALDDVEIRVGLYDFEGGQRMEVESPNNYTIQNVATPAPEKPATDTPSPEATNTLETPQIKETEVVPVQGSLQVRVAYNKDGNVWIWDAGSGPAQLAQDGQVERVWISDDGQHVAFIRDQNIWVVGSDGGGERQLTREEDFQGLSLDEEIAPLITGIIPTHVAWRPNSHQLFFNTSLQMEGSGLFLSDDLWMVNTDSGELSMVLPPDEGGNFYFSPDGQQLAIARPGRIDLMDANGNNRREAFTHTPVITFSEYEYYAQPVWAADSGSLRVAIPPADDLAVATQPTSIWHIPVEDRPSWLVGQVTALRVLHYPPLFEPNLARMAYLADDDPENNPQSNLLDLAVAELSESKVWDPVIYPAEVMNVHGWSPDGMRLLITLPTALLAEITIGQPDIKPLINDGDIGSVSHLTWTDDLRFLYVRYNEGGWQFLLGRVDGSDPVLIDSGTSSPVNYDFTWVPAKTAVNQK